MNAHRLSYLVSSLASDIFISSSPPPQFTQERRPERIWQQKIFCILSSQFSAVRSADIAEYVVRTIPFFDSGPTTREVETECLRLLTTPGYRHRFPNVRAKQIAMCWFPFSQIANEYHEYIASFASEDQARRDIVANFPGMGLKQASMFMRNIGGAQNLAVVDVHVLTYLVACHGWEENQLSPRNYLVAEDIMRRDAVTMGLELNVFDTIVWAAVRAVKGAGYHV